MSQLDELVSRLLPAPTAEEPPTVTSIWRTSHVSADSFFQNKHGEQLNSGHFFVVILMKISIRLFIFVLLKGFHKEDYWVQVLHCSIGSTTVLFEKSAQSCSCYRVKE